MVGLLLLLLLSRFSRVRLCTTPQRAAHQAPRPRSPTSVLPQSSRARAKNTKPGPSFKCMMERLSDLLWGLGKIIYPQKNSAQCPTTREIKGN